MTEHVRARITDLRYFTNSGSTYRLALSGMFSDLESWRSSVAGALGHLPETNWIDPFRELMAEATFNDRFVDTVHDALVNYAPGSHPPNRSGEALASIPASVLDDALEQAGYAGDGSDRSLTEDLFAVLDEDQLADYRALVEAGVPPLQAEMLVSREDPETERFVDGMRLANLNERIATWTGSENSSEFDALVRQRNDLMAELTGSEQHGEFEPDIVAVAAQNGISYEEADFAITTTMVDHLAAEVDGWTGHPNDPRYTEMQVALDQEIERLAEGDADVARQIRVLVNQGRPAGEALFDGVAAAHVDTSIDELLTLLDGRGADPDRFDPVGFALQSALVRNVEEFTGADVADVNVGIAAMAQDNDLTYNSAIALINMDIDGEESEWPPGTEHFAYLDVPIASGEEAAFMMMADEEGLFRVIETANQGDVGHYDGRMSDKDWTAVLADPTAYSDQAVAIAIFFRNNPDEWLRFDTARDGMVLQDLANGNYGVGDGDNVTSWADVQQYVTNQQIFTTLTDELARADSIIRDLDGSGRLDEHEFQAALETLEAIHPNFEGLSEAINFSLEADLLDVPDTRAWYEKVGDGLYTIASLQPGSPSNIYRLLTEPGELAGDYVSFAKGAGNAVVGLGTFAYDLSTISPAGPGFWFETWRVDGDMSEHRGMRLVQTVPQLAEAGLSLVPVTPQYNDALEDVRRQGTWDAHPGLNLGLAVIDWEGFVEDPAAWAGQFAPEVLITVLTGGGGAVTRIGTTGARITAATRRLVVGISANGLRFTARTALRNGLTRAGALGIRWQDGVARFGRQHGNLPTRLRNTWQNRPLTGTLGDANFAQNNPIRGTKKFSSDGQRIFSEAAGFPIETVDDLVEALRTGAIKPSQVQVDYVIIDGQKLILNTRTSTALRRAGIPQSQWHGRDQTGIIAFDDVTFDQLARNQLQGNKLPADGSPSLGIDPPGMVRGEQLTDPVIAQRQIDNAELRAGDRFQQDMNGAGVDRSDIDLMFDGQKPLGFESEAQFEAFTNDLDEALQAAGLGDAEIGLKGTATTFYSENPGKPLGHHWDADPANPGDYDLNITSDRMVETMAVLDLQTPPQVRGVSHR